MTVGCPRILNLPLEYSCQLLQELQALTVVKCNQQYSTLACPYHVNQTSKKIYCIV